MECFEKLKRKTDTHQAESSLVGLSIFPEKVVPTFKSFSHRPELIWIHSYQTMLQQYKLDQESWKT